MSSVGHLAEVGLHPISTWNNPEPEVVLVVSSNGHDRRRDARQRRQPARCRGPLGAAALEGEGQQRERRDRPARLRLFDASLLARRCRADRSAADGHAARTASRMDGASAMIAGSAAIRRISSARRSARTTSIPTASCSISARCSRRCRIATAPARASPTRSATSSPSRHRSSASSPTRCVLTSDAEPWTFGTAALMRNLAGRGLL